MIRDRLVALACEGDARARAELGRWLYAALWQFFAPGRKPDTIDELIQETMVDVWTKAPSQAPRTADDFRKWVLRFAGTEAMTERRDRARVHERELELGLMPAPKTPTSPSAKLLRRQRRLLLEQHAMQLRTKHREVLLHEIAGGTIKQYAAKRGIPVQTARRHRREAIRMIRQLLPAMELDSSV